MTDFFFHDWPHGVGPALVQFALLIAGAATGIRVIDDVKKVVDNVRTRRISG